METNAAATAPVSGYPYRDWRRKVYLAAFFVGVWPLFNVTLVSFIFSQLDIFDETLLLGVGLRVFLLFAAVFLVVSLLETRFPQALSDEKFWPQLTVHLGLFVVFISIGRGVAVDVPTTEGLPQVQVVPAVLLFFETTLYVAVKTYLFQRERHFNTQLNLRQARINLLRSQSNPHFLFNTLNLLASEIPRDPLTAREIVYDLADLLRESMKAAEAEFIAVREELSLVQLYLGLQQKRFPDRLQFDIDVAPECEVLQIPALLLQPVVENAVKHVVAQSTDVVHIGIAVSLVDQELLLRVSDSGPRVDHKAVQRGSGFRIVAETLASHYPGTGRMTFTSSDAGGEVAIHIPLHNGVHLVRA